jgi:hypothetical protein
MISWASIILLVGAALGDVCGAVLRKGDAEVAEVLLAVDGGVLDEGFSKVEGALELTVVGVVIFVADGHEVEVAATLVCVGEGVLSHPNSSERALRSAHQAPARQSPITPPM